jgi:DNA-binding transcriptional ArsR family regulator
VTTAIADDATVGVVFDALADPTRRATLELLRRQPVMTAGEVAAAFPEITRPAVSRHLRLLREAGLVEATQHGREWRYQLRVTPLAELHQHWFARFAPLWDESLERLRSTVEDPPLRADPSHTTR